MSAGIPPAANSDDVDDLPPPPQRLRAPAVTLAVAIAGGILLERTRAWPESAWLGAGAVGLLAAILGPASHRARVGVAGLILASLAWGGLRLQQSSGNREIPWILEMGDDSFPVRVRGQLAGLPRVREADERPFAPVWKVQESVQFEIRDARLSGNRPLGGTVQVSVAGDWIPADVGDEIEVLGHFTGHAPPRNPGEFDRGAWMLGQGIVGIVYCEHPRQVTRIGPGPFHPADLFARWRRRGRAILQATLSPENEPIASALLLGVRTEIDDNLRDAFLITGTMHLLAISGLHVGLVAWLIAVACRACNFSRNSETWIGMAFLAAYAGITEPRSSVFRATVFLMLFLLARRCRRPVGSFQILGLTACLMLSFSPGLLFDVGAQLSFLSVAAILGVQRGLRHIEHARSLAERAARGLPTPWWRRCGWWLRRWLLKGAVVGAAVWFGTLPLSMQNFHRVAPLGIPLTLLLIPLVTAILALGLTLLGVGLLAPGLTSILAEPLDRLVTGLRTVVTRTADWPYASWDVAELPDWWEGGYYLALLFGLARIGRRRWRLLAIGSWAAVGFGLALLAAAPSGRLNVTFLSVGHGAAVIIETPSGELLLYDAGSLDGGQRAAFAIENALRARGRTAVDLVLISHADSDHYSAVPDLVERLSIRSVAVTPQFRNSPKEVVAALARFLREQQVTLREFAARDVIHETRGFRIVALHPARAGQYRSENAASLTLLLEFAGRRILLPGDLEDEGLDELLRQPPLDVDVLLSPHHGSADANPTALAEWSQPERVIVSGGPRVRLDPLHEAYGSTTPIDWLDRGGAVTVTITPDGELRTASFRAETPR